MSNIVLSSIENADKFGIMAKKIAMSGMFGVKNENQVYTLMLISEAKGLHPIEAMQKYNIIQGLPAMKSTEMHSRFLKDGGRIKWIEATNKKAVAELTHPDYDGVYISTYTWEDAVTAGLAGKDNYKKNPKQMMRARALTDGIRAIAPHCLDNMYTDTEVRDFSQEEIEEVIDEVEVIEEPNTGALKRQLWNKLKKLNVVDKDAADFFEKNKEVLEELVNDEEFFTNKLEEFENESK